MPLFETISSHLLYVGDVSATKTKDALFLEQCKKISDCPKTLLSIYQLLGLVDRNATEKDATALDVSKLDAKTIKKRKMLLYMCFHSDKNIAFPVESDKAFQVISDAADYLLCKMGQKIWLQGNDFFENLGAVDPDISEQSADDDVHESEHRECGEYGAYDEQDEDNEEDEQNTSSGFSNVKNAYLDVLTRISKQPTLSQDDKNILREMLQKYPRLLKERRKYSFGPKSGYRTQFEDSLLDIIIEFDGEVSFFQWLINQQYAEEVLLTVFSQEFDVFNKSMLFESETYLRILFDTFGNEVFQQSQMDDALTAALRIGRREQVNFVLFDLGYRPKPNAPTSFLLSMLDSQNLDLSYLNRLYDLFIDAGYTFEYTSIFVKAAQKGVIDLMQQLHTAHLVHFNDFKGELYLGSEVKSEILTFLKAQNYFSNIMMVTPDTVIRLIYEGEMSVETAMAFSNELIEYGLNKHQKYNLLLLLDKKVITIEALLHSLIPFAESDVYVGSPTARVRRALTENTDIDWQKKQRCDYIWDLLAFILSTETGMPYVVDIFRWFKNDSNAAFVNRLKSDVINNLIETELFIEPVTIRLLVEHDVYSVTEILRTMSISGNKLRNDAMFLSTLIEKDEQATRTWLVNYSIERFNIRDRDYDHVLDTVETYKGILDLMNRENIACSPKQLEAIKSVFDIFFEKMLVDNIHGEYTPNSDLVLDENLLVNTAAANVNIDHVAYFEKEAQDFVNFVQKYTPLLTTLIESIAKHPTEAGEILNNVYVLPKEKHKIFNPNFENYQSFTPLQAAILHRDIGLCRALLNAKVRFDLSMHYRTGIWSTDPFLPKSIVPEAKALLDKTADVNVAALIKEESAREAIEQLLRRKCTANMHQSKAIDEIVKILKNTLEKPSKDRQSYLASHMGQLKMHLNTLQSTSYWKSAQNVITTVLAVCCLGIPIFLRQGNLLFWTEGDKQKAEEAIQAIQKTAISV